MCISFSVLVTGSETFCSKPLARGQGFFSRTRPRGLMSTWSLHGPISRVGPPLRARGAGRQGTACLREHSGVMVREWAICLRVNGRTCVPCGERIPSGTACRGPLRQRPAGGSGEAGGGWAGCARSGQVFSQSTSQRCWSQMMGGARGGSLVGRQRSAGSRSRYRLVGGHDSYACGPAPTFSDDLSVFACPRRPWVWGSCWPASKCDSAVTAL